MPNGMVMDLPTRDRPAGAGVYMGDISNIPRRGQRLSPIDRGLQRMYGNSSDTYGNWETSSLNTYPTEVPERIYSAPPPASGNTTEFESAIRSWQTDANQNALAWELALLSNPRYAHSESLIRREYQRRVKYIATLTGYYLTNYNPIQNNGDALKAAVQKEWNASEIPVRRSAENQIESVSGNAMRASAASSGTNASSAGRQSGPTPIRRISVRDLE